MRAGLLLFLSLVVAAAQVPPDGTPRRSGVENSIVTTECENLALGEEPPFPNNYLDLINNYLYPNIREIQRQRDLPGQMRRTFHFPTTGCATGTLKMRDDIPKDWQRGIFQAGAEYPIFVRLSGMDKESQNNDKGDVKGFALKIGNAPGRKLLPGFEDDTHMDIVFNAFPTFPSQNETVFAANVASRVALCGGNDVCRSQLRTKYPEFGPEADAEASNNTVSSQLQMPYYAISPYQFGKRALPNPAVKYRLYPCDYTASIGLAGLTGKAGDYLTQDMTTRLAADSYCFRFQLQFQKDPCIHPINDFHIEWKEEDTPFIDFGLITLPVQTVLTDTSLTCKHAAMNAWRVTEDHRPLGSLSRARMFAMMNSQNHRLSQDSAIEPITGKRLPGLQFLAPQECGINDNFVPKFHLKNFQPGNLLSGENNGLQTGYLDHAHGGAKRVSEDEPEVQIHDFSSGVVGGVVGSLASLFVVAIIGLISKKAFASPEGLLQQPVRSYQAI
jgi:hypothetical protein